jgi:hypothetical protein
MQKERVKINWLLHTGVAKAPVCNHVIFRVEPRVTRTAPPQFRTSAISTSVRVGQTQPRACQSKTSTAGEAIATRFSCPLASYTGPNSSSLLAITIHSSQWPPAKVPIGAGILLADNGNQHVYRYKNQRIIAPACQNTLLF